MKDWITVTENLWRSAKKASAVFCAVLILISVNESRALSSPASQVGKTPPSRIAKLKYDQNYVPGEVLVKFRPSSSSRKRALIKKSVGIQRTMKRFGDGKKEGITYHFKLKPNVSVSQAIRKLRAERSVLIAQPNNIYKLMEWTPNDPLFNDPGLWQWGLNNEGQTVRGMTGVVDADIDAPDGWDISCCDTTPIVAVIDTGIDQTHPDLMDIIWENPEEVPDNGIDDDNNTDGTNTYIDDSEGYNFVGISQRRASIGTGFWIGHARPLAQSIVGTGQMLSEIEVWLGSIGNPQANFIVSVRDALNGNDLAFFTIMANEIGGWNTNMAPIRRDLNTTIDLVVGQTYFIVITPSEAQNSSNFTRLVWYDADVDGEAYIYGEMFDFDGTDWSPTQDRDDIYFGTNGNANPHDDHGHGTHVSGIVGASTDNNIGIAGTSRRTAIMPLKAADSGGVVRTEDLIEAIRYAARNGADIINISLGFHRTDLTPNEIALEQDAVNFAHDHGVTVFSATGNHSGNPLDNFVTVPASLDNVIAIAATNNQDQRAFFSNYFGEVPGDHWGVDIAAPGHWIYSTMPTYEVGTNRRNPGGGFSDYAQDYEFMSGTSMASPMAAGVAATALSFRPSLTPDELEQLLTQNADDLGAPGLDDEFGFGRINMQRTLEALDRLHTSTYDYQKFFTGMNGPAGIAVDSRIDRTPEKILGGDSVIGTVEPTDVAIGPDGDVYVTDSASNRIVWYKIDGSKILWGKNGGDGSSGTGIGEFNNPQGISVDSRGVVYVADTDNHRVQRFNAAGSPIGQPWGRNNGDGTAGVNLGEFDQPKDIAANQRADVYVVDAGNNRIQKFTSIGTPVLEWSEWGSGWMQSFGSPKGIAIDWCGNVYVTENLGARVLKFNASGGLLAELDEFVMHMRSVGVEDVAVDRAGRVFISQGGIWELDSDGDMARSWGGWGDDPRRFKRSRGITVDGHGNLYAADQGNHRVQEFSPAGRIYVSDAQNNRILKYDKAGTLLEKWGKGNGGGLSGTGNGEFDAPADVAVDSSGNVYVADSQNHRVQKFNSAGVFLRKWGKEDQFGQPVSGTGLGEFAFPRGIAVDLQSGTAYVTDDGNRVQRIGPSNVVNLQWGVPGTQEGEFDSPKGIAVDSKSDVYVVDQANNRIQKFGANGDFIGSWGAPGTNDSEFDTPWGVFVDVKGGVYVTDQNNNRIQKFGTNGTHVATWGSPGSGPGQFTSPKGVGADLSGFIYIADSNDHVQKLRPTPTWQFQKTNTSAGTTVTTVSIPFAGGAGVTYDDVTTDGYTIAISSQPVDDPPPGFSFVGEQLDIDTTAIYDGTVTVALTYDDNIVFGDPGALRIFHWTGTSWEDVTFSVDIENNKIIGKASSLSPWILGGPVSPATGANKSGFIVLALLMAVSGIALLSSLANSKWRLGS